MIRRYMCQCMNVSIETLPSQVTENTKDQLFKQIESSYDLSRTEFLKNKFNEMCLEINTTNYVDLMAINYPEFFSLNLKFPLLTGYSIQTASSELRFKLNKCLICNSFTHLIVVTTTNNVNADNTSNTTLSHSSLSANEPSDLLTRTTKTASSSSYNVYLLVNTNQMKRVNNPNDMDEFKKSECYSSTYDILLDSKFKELNNETDNSLFGLDLLLNMESEIGKRVFLNRIEGTFKQQQSSANTNESTNEETFKLKLLDLVNSYITNNNDTIATTTSNVNQENSNINKPKMKRSKELAARVRRAKQYDNENILSSSVFEMEELDEANPNERYLYSDEDASNEEETTTTTTGIEDENLLEHLKNNVLKKRNSNVDEEASDLSKTSKLSIQKNKLHKDLVNSSKYSCSLPRDIPVMQGGRMSTLKNIVNQSSEEENRADSENHYYTNEKADHQKRHKSRTNMTLNRHTQSMSTSFKNQITNDDDSESSPVNNDLYEGDDELFEDDNNNTVNNRCLDEEEDVTNTKNMGQAISNLASSIVIKDGRELFGGVPSRRVPINSISKSCFE